MEDVYSHQFIKIRNLFHLHRTKHFLRKTILNLVEAKEEHNNKSICNAPSKVFPIQTGTFENQGIPGEEWLCCLNPALTKRHFSQITKSRIFKNLNLRRKSDWSFCSNMLGNHFRCLKLHLNSWSWLTLSHCPMGTFWKTRLKFKQKHFTQEQPSRFCYVEVHYQRSLKYWKIGIST